MSHRANAYTIRLGKSYENNNSSCGNLLHEDIMIKKYLQSSLSPYNLLNINTTITRTAASIVNIYMDLVPITHTYFTKFLPKFSFKSLPMKKGDMKPNLYRLKYLEAINKTKVSGKTRVRVHK